MIDTFIMAAALSFQPAMPTQSPATWFTRDDYPVEARKNNEMGFVEFRTDISPEGKPIRCEIMSSSGSKSLDEQTCRIIMSRSRFKPAKDEANRPIFGTYRTQMNWYFSTSAPATPVRWDMELRVTSLPELKGPPIVGLYLLVDTDGRINSCLPNKFDRNIKILGDIACENIASFWQPKPVVDEQGNKVISVQDVLVAFLVTPDAKK